MRIKFGTGTFLIVFCCVYIAAFAEDWPLFRYYPLHGDLSWGRRTVQGVGPAMAWYGLMADALIVAAISAICIPDRIVLRTFRNLFWIFPIAAMAACVLLLRVFFR